MMFTLLPWTSAAGTATASFQVVTNVAPECSVSATPLNFGTFSNLAVPVDATSTVTIHCVSGTAWFAGFDVGTGSGATESARKLTSGGHVLSYSIFKDAARSVALGALESGRAGVLGGTGTGAPEVLTLYGRVFTSPTLPPPGTYTDTITVTVQF